MGWIALVIVISLVHEGGVFHLGGIPIPLLLLFFPVVFALRINPVLVKQEINFFVNRRRFWLFSLLLVVLALASMVQLTDSLFAYRDGGRIVISILSAYVVYYIVKAYQPSVSTFVVLLGLVLVLVALEAFTPVGEYFRKGAAVVAQASLNTSRDLTMAGYVRPTLFSSEPSHLAKTINLLLFSFILTAKWSDGRTWLAVGVIAVALLVIVRSPVILGGVGLVLFGYYLNTVRIYRKAFIVIIGILGVIIFYPLFGDRLENIVQSGGLQNSSEVIRVIVPFVVASDVLTSQYWLTGLGLDAENHVQMVSDVHKILPEYAWLGNNSFGRVLIVYGFMGFAVFGLLSLFLLSFAKDRVTKWLFFSYAVVLSFSTGSITSYLFWQSIFFVMGVYHGMWSCSCDRKPKQSRRIA